MFIHIFLALLFNDQLGLSNTSLDRRTDFPSCSHTFILISSEPIQQTHKVAEDMGGWRISDNQGK